MSSSGTADGRPLAHTHACVCARVCVRKDTHLHCGMTAFRIPIGDAWSECRPRAWAQRTSKAPAASPRVTPETLPSSPGEPPLRQRKGEPARMTD